MRYSDLNINFDRPTIWRRPSVDKLPEQGKKSAQVMKEQEDFLKLKKVVSKELTTVITKNIELSRDINGLNENINEICEYYGKALIATDDVQPDYLLKKTNKNTLTKKLQGWCSNLIGNIPDVIDAKPYKDLIGKFKDVPAFVCMAGPSLANNREKLLKVKGKSLIICVDTSLRPLLDVGVVPDICITHDANPNGCKFFLSGEHSFNKDNIQLNDKGDNELGLVYALLKKDRERLKFKYDTLGLFVNYCHPLTLAAWNGREKRFYGIFDPSLPVYNVMASATNYKLADKKLIPEDKGMVVGGSSVGHVAVYIAIALGCNPISLLGLDLSYPGGQTYIKGASNQKEIKEKSSVMMRSLSGGKVKTNVSMLSYKFVFEQAFPFILEQNPKLKLYNCTENDKGKICGILEVGAEPRNIDLVIDEHCKKEIDILKVFNKEGDKSERK